ncbi:MAG: hydroxylamine reductase, partial [Bacteroidales bacterium]|nr:hydroxylamine reductase [Bacteroidales bacterium]
MFCYQCQETAKGIGCTISGVCGKKEDVSNLQDLLIHILKGISLYSNEARKTDFDDSKINRFIIESLFTTITNANFDKEVFYKRVRKALEWRDLVKNHCISKNLDISHITHDSAVWSGTSEAEMEEKSKSVGILSYENEDIRSLVHLMLFGVKGMAAYAEHASNLGHENEEIHAFVQKALAESTRNDLTADYLISLVMETGK